MAGAFPKKETLVSREQPLNAQLSIIVTVSGTTALVKLPHPAKALRPIATTGHPSILPGMTTSPPAPL
jgi:hypothetical protein